jgi:hypothetical protein
MCRHRALNEQVARRATVSSGRTFPFEADALAVEYTSRDTYLHFASSTLDATSPARGARILDQDTSARTTRTWGGKSEWALIVFYDTSAVTLRAALR